MSEMKFVKFTQESLVRFKAAYEKAVADKQEQFTFEGNEFILGYAKYAIEYLEGEFAKQQSWKN